MVATRASIYEVDERAVGGGAKLPDGGGSYRTNPKNRRDACRPTNPNSQCNQIKIPSIFILGGSKTLSGEAS